MDVVYERERATAAEIHAAIADPPSYSAIRATLRILEDKGHLRHEEENQRYVFLPVVPKKRASLPALRHLIDTFFEGRPERVVATLLDPSAGKLSEEELERMAKMIERARKERAAK